MTNDAEAPPATHPRTRDPLRRAAPRLPRDCGVHPHPSVGCREGQRSPSAYFVDRSTISASRIACE